MLGPILVLSICLVGCEALILGGATILAAEEQANAMRDAARQRQQDTASIPDMGPAIKTYSARWGKVPGRLHLCENGIEFWSSTGQDWAVISYTAIWAVDWVDYVNLLGAADEVIITTKRRKYVFGIPANDAAAARQIARRSGVTVTVH